MGQAVDQQPWDPSVKALTAFPSVLGNMDKNLSWTSSLGDAYYNQQEDVMDAVQVMRQRAQQAGNLKTTPQQTVTSQGTTVVIQPANPDVVYVPAYNPGWCTVVRSDRGRAGIRILEFGMAARIFRSAGFGIGFFGGYGWGWGRWGFDWHNRYPIYNHNRYYSRSNTFYNRRDYYRGGPRGGARDAGNRPPNRGNIGGRGGFTTVGLPGPSTETIALPEDTLRLAGQSGVRSGAFSG